MLPRQVPYDPPSFLFTHYHPWPIEYAVGAILIVIALIFLLILRATHFIRVRNRVIFSTLLVFFAAWLLYSPSPLRPHLHGSYGEVHHPISAYSKLGSVITRGHQFVEAESNRTLLLRGVNVGGGAKIPSAPFQPTHRLHAEFYTGWKNVSFIDRPIPLAEAEIHFGRLASAGLSFLRLLTTWEAIEHAGPGVYDYEYLDYLRSLIRVANRYNVSCYVDMHQDVWSRWTGGDGAPAWTLEAVGFNLSTLHDTQAAFLHAKNGERALPSMSWPTNYGHLAAGTMFTIFFAGNEYAPHLRIGEESAQDYLQRHYAQTVQELAKALKDESNVIGFDIMNEPSEGFVGIEDIGTCSWIMRSAYTMSTYDGFLLGAGHSRLVDYYSDPFVYSHTELINQQHLSAWLPGRECIWKSHGVWEDGPTPRLLRPDYFRYVPSTGKVPNFLNDFAVPLYKKAAAAIHQILPQALILVEPTMSFGPMKHTALDVGAREAEDGFVWAPHWYDGIQLLTKSFRHWLSIDAVSQLPVLGWEQQALSHARNIGKLIKLVDRVGESGIPSIIGEIGIAMDMIRNKHTGPIAYETDDYSYQLEAAGALLHALDRNKASFSWWCYVPDNTYRYGDQWNEEDLSIFSLDRHDPKSKDIFSGGRILEVLVRPYPRKISGTLQSLDFDAFSREREFLFTFSHDPTVREEFPTEIFVPRYQYPHGFIVEAEQGRYESYPEQQVVLYYPNPVYREHRIFIRRADQ